MYILAQILHDWDDERCGVILRNCRRAMPPAGKLLVVEQVLPPANEPSPSKWLDLHMLVLLGPAASGRPLNMTHSYVPRDSRSRAWSPRPLGQVLWRAYLSDTQHHCDAQPLRQGVDR